MMTFRVSHFENKRFLLAAFNGGKLYVTDDEYIIKWLFVKIRFPRDKTQIVFSSDFFLWKCYYFKSGKRVWEVQFSSKVAEEFSKFIKF